MHTRVAVFPIIALAFTGATWLLPHSSTPQTSLASATAALSSCIDFETVPGNVRKEGLLISNQYKSTYGVTFSLETGGSPRLAAVGSPVTRSNLTSGTIRQLPTRALARCF
jgi:hypothetical protein